MTTPNGPTVPDTYTAADDVNPVCGCHRRANCVGCGVCTTCDGCYCGEDDRDSLPRATDHVSAAWITGDPDGEPLYINPFDY